MRYRVLGTLTVAVLALAWLLPFARASDAGVGDPASTGPPATSDVDRADYHIVVGRALVRATSAMRLTFANLVSTPGSDRVDPTEDSGTGTKPGLAVSAGQNSPSRSGKARSGAFTITVGRPATVVSGAVAGLPKGGGVPFGAPGVVGVSLVLIAAGLGLRHLAPRHRKA